MKISNLLEADFIREMEYPNWLAKLVLVPKKCRKLRVCVEYTNLNGVCPNDSFSLPRVNQLVDAIVGHGMLSFPDAFSKYHQILMHPPDLEKIAFISPQGLYHYNEMHLA